MDIPKHIKEHSILGIKNVWNKEGDTAKPRSSIGNVLITGSLGLNKTPDYILDVGSDTAMFDKIRVRGEPTDSSLFGVSQDKALYIKTPQAQDGFSIEQTDNGVLGPVIDLIHNSSNPAANDEVGRWRVIGKDNNGDYRIYGQMNIKIVSTTSGASDGQFKFEVERGGGLSRALDLNMGSATQMVVSDYPFGTDNRNAYFQSKRITEGAGYHTYLKASDAITGTGSNYNGGNINLIPGEGIGTGTDGKIGIGTTSPEALLHIIESGATLYSHVAAFENNDVTDGQIVYIDIAKDSSSSDGGVIGYVWKTDSTERYIAIGNLADTLGSGLNILKGGNVGIKTINPTSSLQVIGLPVYTTNAMATASGLTAGAFYRTGGDPDPVCVVH